MPDQINIQNQLLAHADTIDLEVFANLPVAPLKLTDDQVEQLTGIGPGELAKLAYSGGLDAPPKLSITETAGMAFMAITSPGMTDIVAVHDRDLDRWLILTTEAGTRYLMDPGCVRELDRPDVMSSHREKQDCIDTLYRLTGPTPIDRVERAAAEYARSACLAATAAMSLALWVKSENDAQAIVDDEFAEYEQSLNEKNQVQLSNY